MKTLVLATFLATLALPALADSVRPVTDAETKAACGECHMVFQPAFLPARSWNKIMDGLKDHFGDNASLAPDKVARIRKVLVDGAGDAGGNWGREGKTLRGLEASATPLRLTEMPRFTRKHDRIAAREWKRPEVLTKSNCAACHSGAEKGYYEDD